MTDREIDVLEKAVGALVKTTEATHPQEADNLRIAMQTLRLEHEYRKTLPPKPKPVDLRAALPGLVSALAILAAALLTLLGVDVKGLLP